MIALCLLAGLALASSAPQYYFPATLAPMPSKPRMSAMPQIPGMREVDRAKIMAQDLEKWNKFKQTAIELPQRSPYQAVRGDEYVVVLNVQEFEAKGIIKVTAGEGRLLVDAVHRTESGHVHSTTFIESLPPSLNIHGSWTYDMGTLRILFPQNSLPKVTKIAAVDVITQAPEFEDSDSEEMDPSVFQQMSIELKQRLPSQTERMDDYVVVVPMQGYEAKDIKVKAREGGVLIEAVHGTDSENKHSMKTVRPLPPKLNIHGSWTYDMGELRIIFPQNTIPKVTKIEHTDEEKTE